MNALKVVGDSYVIAAILLINFWYCNKRTDAILFLGYSTFIFYILAVLKMIYADPRPFMI